MKYFVAAMLIGFASLSYAVSIDFLSLSAVTIGDLETHRADDGTVSHSIDFSGPELKTLAKMLPAVDDENGRVEGMHMINITNAGQANVDEDKATSIYLECNIVEKENTTKCNLTIIKGIIPG